MKTTKELARELGLLRRRSNKPSKGLKPSRGVRQPFSYLVVIDFESTCWKDKNYRTQEVIEFPAVLLNTATGACESEFHYYVLPYEQPTLSDFCKELTGITQGQVEDGIPLSLCMKKFGHWIDRLHKEKGVLFNPPSDHPVKGTFLTWSDWDLGVCLQYECRRKQIMKPAYLNSWIDIRATYRTFYDRKPNGLNGALQDLGITFAGRQHSGVDDARNTARLAWRMMCDGCVMNVTKSLDKDIHVHSSERPIDTIFQRLDSKTCSKKLIDNSTNDCKQNNQNASHSTTTTEQVKPVFKRSASPGSTLQPKLSKNIESNSQIQKRSRLSLTDNQTSTSSNASFEKQDVVLVRGPDTVRTDRITPVSTFGQKEIYQDHGVHSSRITTFPNSVDLCNSTNTGPKQKLGFPTMRDTNIMGDREGTKLVNPKIASSAKLFTTPMKENLHPSLFKKPAMPTAPGDFRTPSSTCTGVAESYNCMKTPVTTSSRIENANWSTSKATPPLCKCGRRSKRRFVQSPGPNQGRCFFGCSIGKREGWSVKRLTKTGCDFFKWESSMNIGQTHFTPLPARTAMSTGCIRRQPPRLFRQTPVGNVPLTGTLPLKRSLGMQTQSIRGSLRS